MEKRQMSPEARRAAWNELWKLLLRPRPPVAVKKGERK